MGRLVERIARVAGRPGRRSTVATASMAAAILGAGAAGDVNLELRPSTTNGVPGVPVDLALFAVAGGEQPEAISAVQVIFTWNPRVLQMLGIDNTGSAPLIFSLLPFPDTLLQLNEANPPADGDGLYVAGAIPGTDLFATPEGIKLTTLRFMPLTDDSLGQVALAPTGGIDGNGEPGETIVFSGVKANTPITGTLAGGTIVVGCPADANGDDVVNVDDLLLVLLDWGQEGQLTGDVTDDLIVNVDDLLLVLLAWGPCE
ncbi:MAG: hypothetical protein ACYTGC_18495 [Planctomycetota bacterium]|jgi:hypothetical protein